MNLHSLRYLQQTYTINAPSPHLPPRELDELAEALTNLRDACEACEPPQDPDVLSHFITDMHREVKLADERHPDLEDGTLDSLFSVWVESLPDGAEVSGALFAEWATGKIRAWAGFEEPALPNAPEPARGEGEARISRGQ